MALSSRNSNFSTGIALEIYTSAPGAGPQNAFVPSLIDYASLYIQAGSSSGSASFLVLGQDGAWRPASSPGPVVFTANSSFGPIGFGGVTQGPALGWQVLFTVSSGSVTYAELDGVVRP